MRRLQTWEELSEEKGLDVPMLLTSKMPTRLRMDIRGQRDWFREQHSFMRCSRGDTFRRPKMQPHPEDDFEFHTGFGTSLVVLVYPLVPPLFISGLFYV